MQVTHAADHITHAMIGGAQTREFKVSSSAALMHMLSTALYSDPKLAVAREVLCNSWDAHIRAGREDQAIIVTVTDEKIIVRDFGAGIADEMIDALYGTYGGTDKLNNGTETGGFGLGCKSPFSYNDHFELISWHAGTKTIYNCSKSSADRFGKPVITTIVSLPTDETGIQVTIPLKHYTDNVTFIKLLTRIAFNGEMNVTVNGMPIEPLPLSKGDNGWIITRESLLDTSHQVMVRYGNVIYPVETNPAYAFLHGRLVEFLCNLPKRSYGAEYAIVLQAKPDTISVTPSRESLLMQEHTINTLMSLMDKFFVPYMDEKIAEESWALLDQQILKVSEENRTGELMTNKRSIPGIELNGGGFDMVRITNISDVANQYTRKQYPKDKAFYRRDMSLRIEMAQILNAGKRGHLEEVKVQTCTEPKKLKTKKIRLKGKTQNLPPHEWFKRKVVRPLVGAIAAHPMLDVKRLSIRTSDSYDTTTTCEPMRYKRNEYSGYLPILRNILVIAYSKKELWHKICHNKDLIRMGGNAHIWVYHAPVAKTRIQETRDFFKAKGFFIIDLTVEEVMAIYRPAKPAPEVVAQKAAKKARMAGYPALSGVNVVGKPSRVDNCFLEGQPRITKPLFYAKVNCSKQPYRSLDLGRFSDAETAQVIVQLFGDVCAVVHTTVQAEKLKKEGLMELSEYVMGHVTKAITTSPSFIAYWAEDLNRALGNMDGKPVRNDKDQLMIQLLDVPEVRKAVGLKLKLDDNERALLNLWRSMADNMRHYETQPLGDSPTIADARKTITALPIAPTILEITKNLAGNHFGELIDMDAFRKIARQPNAKANGHFDRLAKIAKLALVG